MLSGAVALAALAAVICFAPAAYAISMSDADHPHNFAATSNGVLFVGETEVCVVCHVPHPGDTTTPLWNHNVASETFTEYTSSSLDGTINLSGSRSLLCLSCHDGNSAIDSYGGTPTAGTDTMATYAGSFLPGNTAASMTNGTDMQDDHPVGIDFVDTGLRGVGDSWIGGGGTVQDLLFDRAGTDQVECASCHDAHGAQAAGLIPLLRITTAASALCLTCHDK
jgi:predicted CXXCH cytochrome family protein